MNMKEWTERRYDTREVLQAYDGYVRRFGKRQPAWEAMVTDYLAGKTVGGVNWRDVWRESDELAGLPMPERIPEDMPLPGGWDYMSLFCRHRRMAAGTGMTAEQMVRIIRNVIIRCDDSGPAVLDALLEEAERWRMRRDELEVLKQQEGEAK